MPSRAYHTKSRHGCTKCKQRRVKACTDWGSLQYSFFRKVLKSLESRIEADRVNNSATFNDHVAIAIGGMKFVISRRVRSSNCNYRRRLRPGLRGARPLRLRFHHVRRNRACQALTSWTWSCFIIIHMTQILQSSPTRLCTRYGRPTLSKTLSNIRFCCI